MKHIGVISVYFESRGFGFIKYDQIISKGTFSNDIFFHVNDCSFEPQKDECVIFDMKLYRGNKKAIHVKRLVEEFDYLLNNWGEYSIKDKNRCCLAFENEFIHYGPYQKKLIELAKGDIPFKDECLQQVFSSIKERSAKVEAYITEKECIEEAGFVDECQKIIDKLVPYIIKNECSDLDFSLCSIPSYDELHSAFMSFLQSEKPSIVYTHTIEDGYWHTRWKWDGSEDYWVAGKEYSDFEVHNVFSIKGISVNIGHVGAYSSSHNGSGNYDEDIQSKNRRVLGQYEALKDRRSLCDKINASCKRKREELIKKITTDIHSAIKQPILDELIQYLTLRFPLYGEGISNLLTTLSKKNYEFVDNSCYNRILAKMYIPMPNMNSLKENLLIINRYMLNAISVYVEDLQSLKFKNIILNPFSAETKEQDGLILSLDESILYAIIDTNLQEIIIPESVTSIGDGAFNDCLKLQKIHFLGSITRIGHGAFLNTKSQICGDFSKLSFLGFNTSTSILSINNQSKTIAEWSYLFNQTIIDNTEITIKKIHIEHQDD
ncbi:MAG: leucine-rich repeat domain-containing protein [Paludibacteraceae bacterium]|nr:leucine-rich repeat domain-containing protein [Paludibacteraceae bacterium]